MKILIIQNKRIGDVLLASIIPNNLKKKYPNSVIFFLCYDYAAPVLENNPNIDHIIAVKEKELKQIKNLISTAFYIKDEKFDVIIDPYVKFQSQFLSLFSNAKKRISYQKKTLPLAYTHKIPILEEQDSPFGKAIDDRINLIKCLDGETEIEAAPKLFLTEEEKNEGASILAPLNKNRKTIMFGILGSDASKSLPVSYTAEIINYLIDNYDVNIIFNYIPSQRPSVDKILAEVKTSDKIYPDIFGKSLRDFIKIVYHCDGMIANEGGSIHIAKAFKKATFTIFSPYIVKEFWATFENEPQNQSIHLKDVKPELFAGKSKKELYKQSSSLYHEFTPDYILPQINEFMKKNSF
ncbi:glycosyltransferase family 9 protein [Autumnicola psychrophila]|uniref:Glycosyltransferase family 9 protein n=1 Tax=Autumnicola psychrophila TaxID=3075592 RepID=A0ABU3DTQ3_9FLAO|nr:glycosyltransferase family 9 protein [Zunongwangia sp. F225]MDT0687092.1 glycosyltransferase family 9 protein [Zunongwangia sp. F225]